MTLGDRLRAEYREPDEMASVYDRIAHECEALTKVGIRKHWVSVRPELARGIAERLRSEGCYVDLHSDHRLEVRW